MSGTKRYRLPSAVILLGYVNLALVIAYVKFKHFGFLLALMALVITQFVIAIRSLRAAGKPLNPPVSFRSAAGALVALVLVLLVFTLVLVFMRGHLGV